MRLHLGGRAHPGEAVDRRRIRLHQVVDQLHHARLVGRREVLGHVDLADGLAHGIVERAHRAFPARTVSGRAVEGHAAELEARIAHVGRQLQRQRVDQAHAQVGLPDVQRLGLDQPGQRPGVAGLRDRDERRVDQVAGGEEGLPVDVGRLRGELLDRHRVVGLDRIAVGFLRPLHLREARFQAHDRGGFDAGVLAARDGQQLVQIGTVGRARLGEACVLLQVVIAIAQAQATLCGAGRVDRRILGVGADAQAQRRVDEAVPLRDQQQQVLLVLDGVDLRQVRRERLHAGGVDRRGVHVAGVEVADLGVDRAGGLRLGGQAFDDRLDALVGQVVELREGAVVGLVGRDRRLLQPGAVHGAEQAVLRTHAGIHAGLVQARTERGGGGGDGRHGRGGGGVGREGQVGGECQRQSDDQRRGAEGVQGGFLGQVRHKGLPFMIVVPRSALYPALPLGCCRKVRGSAGSGPAGPVAERPLGEWRRQRICAANSRRNGIRPASRMRPEPQRAWGLTTTGCGRPAPSTSCRPAWWRTRRGSRRC